VSRDTISRQWTDNEVAIATEIVNAVALGDGALVGTMSVLRAMGWPRTEAGKQHLWDIMPLAVMLAPSIHPGKALIVQPDHVYRITDDIDVAKRVSLTRAKQVRTKVERMAAELAPLAGSSSLGNVVIRQQVTLLLNALDPDVWDALIAEVEEASV
jgi:hypothetical protein